MLWPFEFREMQGSPHAWNSAEDIATVVASAVVVELLSPIHSKSFCGVVRYKEQRSCKQVIAYHTEPVVFQAGIGEEGILLYRFGRFPVIADSR